MYISTFLKNNIKRKYILYFNKYSIKNRCYSTFAYHIFTLKKCKRVCTFLKQDIFINYYFICG